MSESRYCLPTGGSFEVAATDRTLEAFDCPLCGGVHKYSNGGPSLAPAIMPDDPSGRELEAVAEAFHEAEDLDELSDRLESIKERYPRRRGRLDDPPCDELGEEHAWMAVLDRRTGEPTRESCLACPAVRVDEEDARRRLVRGARAANALVYGWPFGPEEVLDFGP